MIHRQWPIAVLMIAMLGAQMYLIWPPTGRPLVMFGVVTAACAAAVFAHRHIVATTVLCVAVLTGTVLLDGLGRALFLPVAGVEGPYGFALGPGPLSFPETAAVLTLTVVVARTARPRVTAAAFTALLLLAVHSSLVRTDLTWARRESFAILLLLLVTAAAIGMLLRSRDRERALAEVAAVERAHREERLELARELHDMVAHHVTGMLVLAQAANIVSEEDKDTACAMIPRSSPAARTPSERCDTWSARSVRRIRWPRPARSPLISPL